MKSLIFLALTLFGTQAFAQQLTCVYQANTHRGTKNVILNFGQMGWGGPATDGSIKVVQPDGSVDVVRIPARNITIQSGQMADAELFANVHVRSYEVDLVLVYQGNELSNDVANYLGIRGRVTERELMDGYDQLMRMSALQHRNAMPMAQFSGSVRDPYDGRILKFASTQFQCSSTAFNH